MSSETPRTDEVFSRSSSYTLAPSLLDLARQFEIDLRECVELLARWNVVCDLSGVMPVSGNVDDQPVMALLRDTRAALARLQAPTPKDEI